MITQERLKELMHYCPDSGLFTRLISTSNRAPSGSIAGSITLLQNSKTQYLRIGMDGENYGAHRLAFLYMTGSMAKVCIDHRDGDGLNNKWGNLRGSTKTDNAKNCYMSSANTSGTTGVCWSKAINRWIARIHADNKPKHLGCFKIKDDAIKCRKAAEKLYGYSERHGEPYPSTS